MKHLDELQKELTEIKKKLTEASGKYPPICGSVVPHFNFSFSQTSTRVSMTVWKHGTCFLFLKGELQPKIPLLHMKVLTLIKAKSNHFFDTSNAAAAREDRKPKY